MGQDRGGGIIGLIVGVTWGHYSIGVMCYWRGSVWGYSRVGVLV